MGLQNMPMRPVDAENLFRLRYEPWDGRRWEQDDVAVESGEDTWTVVDGVLDTKSQPVSTRFIRSELSYSHSFIAGLGSPPALVCCPFCPEGKTKHKRE